MAEYVVLNNDESVDYTDTLPDPSSFAYAIHRSSSNVIKANDAADQAALSMANATPTLDASDGQRLSTETSGPSSFAANVTTPTRLESRTMVNMGNFSDPLRRGVPVTTPTRRESRSMPSTVGLYKSKQSDTPVAAPRPLHPREVPLGSSMFSPSLPPPSRP